MSGGARAMIGRQLVGSRATERGSDRRSNGRGRICSTGVDGSSGVSTARTRMTRIERTRPDQSPAGAEILAPQPKKLFGVVDGEDGARVRIPTRKGADPAVPVQSVVSAFRRSTGARSVPRPSRNAQRASRTYVHHRGRRGASRAMMPNPTATPSPLSSTIAITTYIRKSTTRGVSCWLIECIHTHPRSA
jgi:hypothetical protein